MWLANAVSSGAKYATPAGGLVLADLTVGGINLETYGGIVIGLIAGAILKSSRFVDEQATWGVIRRDLLVSALSGLANFIVAAILVASAQWAMPGFPTLAAAGVGLLVGFKGRDGVTMLREMWRLPEETRADRFRREMPRAQREVPDDMLNLADRLDRKGQDDDADG